MEKRFFGGQAPNLPHEEGEKRKKSFFHPLYHLLSGIKDRRRYPFPQEEKGGKRENLLFPYGKERGASAALFLLFFSSHGVRDGSITRGGEGGRNNIIHHLLSQVRPSVNEYSRVSDSPGDFRFRCGL